MAVAYRKTRRGGNKTAAQTVDGTATSTEKQRSRGVQKRHPSEADIIDAVSSLYEDQLRPFSRIVRKRLTEHAEARNAVHVVDCDTAWFRSFCEDSSLMEVNTEGEGDWSISLIGRAHKFVDFFDPEDKYPEKLWADMKSYCDKLARGKNARFPGGRYGSACVLKQRGCSFLSGRTLGEVCHIVELAISKHSILGYSEGAVVPYKLSTSMRKSECARNMCSANPETNGDDGTVLAPVDWDTARATLKEIIEYALRNGAQYVPLSNIKRIFRSVYKMDLSETKLGYSKLTHFLQDDRLADICTVKLQDNGFAVYPGPQDVDRKDHMPVAQTVDSADLPCHGNTYLDANTNNCQHRRGHSLPRNFGSMSRSDRDTQDEEDVESSGLATAAHLKEAPNGERNLHQIEAVDDSECGDDLWRDACRALGLVPHDVTALHDNSCENTTHNVHDRVPLLPAQSLSLHDICCDDSNKTPLTTPCLLMTPSPMHVYSHLAKPCLAMPQTQVQELAVPFTCRDGTVSVAWNATCHAFGLCAHDTNALTDEGVNDMLVDAPTERIRKFCTEDPLRFEGVEIGSDKAPSGSPMPLMTPSPLFSCGHTEGLLSKMYGFMSMPNQTAAAQLPAVFEHVQPSLYCDPTGCVGYQELKSSERDKGFDASSSQKSLSGEQSHHLAKSDIRVLNIANLI